MKLLLQISQQNVSKRNPVSFRGLDYLGRKFLQDRFTPFQSTTPDLPALCLLFRSYWTLHYIEYRTGAGVEAVIWPPPPLPPPVSLFFRGGQGAAERRRVDGLGLVPNWLVRCPPHHHHQLLIPVRGQSLLGNICIP